MKNECFCSLYGTMCCYQKFYPWIQKNMKIPLKVFNILYYTFSVSPAYIRLVCSGMVYLQDSSLSGSSLLPRHGGRNPALFFGQRK